MRQPLSAAGVRLRVGAQSVPKHGRTPAENEDSVAADPVTARFAVADGASTSARPEVWSRILVDAFVREGLDPLSPDIRARLRDRWWRQVATPALPWFAVAKLRQGGSAAFVSLEFDLDEGTFRAAAVGDSCLFQLRGGRLVFAGPLSRSAQFSRYPVLLGTQPDGPDPVKAMIWEGAFGRGDEFVLATDAVAKFLLLVHETHGRMPSLAGLVRSHEHFQRSVALYRHRQLMPNDDATACVVRT